MLSFDDSLNFALLLFPACHPVAFFGTASDSFMTFSENFDKSYLFSMLFLPMILLVVLVSEAVLCDAQWYRMFGCRIIFILMEYYMLLICVLSSYMKLFHMSGFVFSAAFILVISMKEVMVALKTYRTLLLKIEQQDRFINEHYGHATVLQNLSPDEYRDLKFAIKDSKILAHLMSAVFMIFYYFLHLLYFQYLIQSPFKMGNMVSTGIGMASALLFYKFYGMPDSVRILGVIQVE